MNPVITAVNKIISNDTEKIFSKLGKKLKPMRFIHDLDKLTIAAIGITLEDAMIPFPVGNSDISLSGVLLLRESLEQVRCFFPLQHQMRLQRRHPYYLI